MRASYTEPIGEHTLEWPYPIHYGNESEITADVLIVGGGIAGCHAAINAAKKGAKVVVVDKASIQRSGSGGAGIDHWGNAFTNPCSKITPDDYIEEDVVDSGYSFKHLSYINCKESWDALLDVEKMGITIRDVDDEFVGAEFRDEKTKLMFAYDYENRHCIRLQGAEIKPAMYKELKRLGVTLCEHVMTTALLTLNGEPGSKIVGATGVNVRTGEFYVFKSKATILSTAEVLRLWVFSTELNGNNDAHRDPNNTGDGCAMAWEAGAEFALMERSGPSLGGFRTPPYGVGNAHNTWFACNIVDANGKEVPWVDRDGKVLKTVSERSRPSSGQKMVLHGDARLPYEVKAPTIIPNLPERISKGEFKLPLYADLPSMPEHERRAIFGLMVGHEGKTRIPIYEMYTKAGFDPDKDMLQVTVMPPDAYTFGPWMGKPVPQWRETEFAGGGGIVVDWDLKTRIEGLYAAGNQLAIGIAQTVSHPGHPTAATTGRYAGRKAAAYAKKATVPVIDREQVEKEKARVYAPVFRKDGIGWKELQAGVCRIMQDYCSEYKSEDVLEMGLGWLKSIEESEAQKVYARNPHELWRTLEVFSRITVGKMIMHTSLARKASSAPLNFKRIDYPETDPPEWDKFVTIRMENGQIKIGELPFNYWLLPPNAPTYEENYDKHSCL